MNRKDAIDVLVRHALPSLSSEARGSLLLDWWTIDSADPEYEALPSDLKARLVSLDEPDDPADPVYDPLILLAGRRSFVGTVNRYLAAQLEVIGCKEEVTGPVEQLASCPCCQCRSLLGRGMYEICRVCFWEDDGTNDLDRQSGPNHMTLRQARVNYHRFGAVSESAAAHVLPDGGSRFVSGPAQGTV